MSNAVKPNRRALIKGCRNAAAALEKVEEAIDNTIVLLHGDPFIRSTYLDDAHEALLNLAEAVWDELGGEKSGFEDASELINGKPE